MSNTTTIPGEHGSLDMLPVSEDHTSTRRSEAFGYTQHQAANRADVIFDPDLQLFRDVTDTDVINGDTVRSWSLDGVTSIDLTNAEAVEYGLTEWDDAWGDRTVDPTELTEAEQQALEEGWEEQAATPEGLFEGFSEDAPVEGVNLALEAVINGYDPGELANYADYIDPQPDGSVVIADEARERLQASLGIPDVEAYAADVYQAWSKVAVEAIGQDAVDTLSTACQHNDYARQDVLALYRRALTGQLTKAEICAAAEKWGA